MSRSYRTGETPKIPIFICAAGALTPVSGLGGGSAYFINPSGAAVAATNTLVEIDATHAKGWYYVLVAGGDNLGAGEWTLSYQTPSTFANVGKTNFAVNPPAVNVSNTVQDGLVGLFGGSTTAPTLNVQAFLTNMQEIAAIPDLQDSGDTSPISNLMRFVVFLYQMLREKVVADKNKIVLYASDGTSPVAQASVLRDGTDPDNPVVTRSRFDTPP